MLLPERSALISSLQLAARATGPGRVERINTGGLLVHGDGTGVVWPEPSNDAAGALGGQSVVGDAEVGVLEWVFGEEAEEVAVDAFEVGAVLVAVQEAADG